MVVCKRKGTTLNNAIKFAAIFAVACMFFACGDDSGSDAKSLENDGSEPYSEVETVRNLGRCTEDRDGDTVYVVEKLRDYVCKNRAWVDASEENDLERSSSSKEIDGKGESSSSEKGDVGAKSSSSEKVGLSAGSSSSENGNTETSSSSFNKDAYTGENLVVKGRSILGVAQKGPFKFGSPVFLRELTKDKLEYTGMVYQDEVNSNKGDFVIPNVNMISPYASIEVRGLFRNEVTGEYSKDSVSLFALTDLTTRSKVNVNLLTHLEYSRAMYLVRKGYSVNAAKKQADQEIMTAFELPTTVTSSEDLSVFEDSHDNNANYANASLMMMSLLFLGERSDAEFKNAIDKFIEDFEKDGSWDDENTKAAMADFATEVGSAKIRTNVSSWNVLDIPKFEDPLETFWNNVYGLGGCTESRSGVILKNKNAKSKNADVYYKCNASRSNVYPYDYTDGHWVKATQVEYDTYGIACSGDGTIVSGNVNKETKYVCDAGVFRIATEKEIEFKRGCTSYTMGIVDTTFVNSDTVEVWICATTGEYELQSPLLMKDTRDGKIYRTVSIGTQRWMAENLNYETANSFCYEDNASNCTKYGRLYTWAAAMDSAGVYSENSKGCGYYGETCTITSPVRGICPEGWHIPTAGAWNTLYSAIGSSPYAMQAKGYWSDPNDTYGFAALPAGYYYDRKFYYVGSRVIFWSATEYNKRYAYIWYLDADHAYLNSDYSKYYGFVVRCLKDSP